MKKQVMTAEQVFHTEKPGFTLVEVAIAMGMVAVMISSFMVVFGPAIARESTSRSAPRKQIGWPVRWSMS